MLFLNGGAIALITTEAEFCAMCDTAKEVRQLPMVLLGELGFKLPVRSFVEVVGGLDVKKTGAIFFEDNVNSNGVGKQDTAFRRRNVTSICVFNSYRTGFGGVLKV